MYQLVRNRLLLMQKGFRQNNLYAFWFLNRIITKERRMHVVWRMLACLSPCTLVPGWRCTGTLLPRKIQMHAGAPGAS
jgi:hypothetical protein